MAGLIGIDLGTSSVRVVALDASGGTVALQSREYLIRRRFFSTTAPWPRKVTDGTSKCPGRNFLE
jgi:sugar (pentulose or hexulose) kinase